MKLSGFQIDWKKIVGIALDLSVCGGAWKLFVVVQLLTRSIVIAMICSTLFLITGMAVHRVARQASARWQFVALLLIYSFKVIPAFAYSIEVHENEIEYEMLVGASPPTVSKHDEADQHGSLRIAKCVVWVITRRPLAVMIAILLTWAGVVSSDILALLLHSLHRRLANLDPGVDTKPVSGDHTMYPEATATRRVETSASPTKSISAPSPSTISRDTAHS